MDFLMLHSSHVEYSMYWNWRCRKIPVYPQRCFNQMKYGKSDLVVSNKVALIMSLQKKNNHITDFDGTEHKHERGCPIKWAVLSQHICIFSLSLCTQSSSKAPRDLSAQCNKDYIIMHSKVGQGLRMQYSQEVFSHELVSSIFDHGSLHFALV